MLCRSGSDPDEQRGIRYADGGIADVAVFYPDVERIAEFHREWARVEQETDVV